MSIYSNVTEQNLLNLRKLAEQQKNQLAEKIKNRILKQTHVIKLAETLSPITKKLDEVKVTTQKIGDVIKKSQTETPQLTIENTPNHQPIENNQDETQPGVLYDVELEDTLKNMKNNIGFFIIEETNDGNLFWNGFPIEKTGSSKLKINKKIYNITPGIQKVLTDTTNIPIKKLNDQDRE